VGEEDCTLPNPTAGKGVEAEVETGKKDQGLLECVRPATSPGDVTD